MGRKQDEKYLLTFWTRYRETKQPAATGFSGYRKSKKDCRHTLKVWCGVTDEREIDPKTVRCYRLNHTRVKL